MFCPLCICFILKYTNLALYKLFRKTTKTSRMITCANPEKNPGNGGWGFQGIF